MAETCAPCAYSAVHKWWGPDHKGTHCKTCHRSWTSVAEAHCATCHEHFASHVAADQHWINGKHVDVTAVPLRKDGTARLELRDRASGPTWVVGMDAAARARLVSTPRSSDLSPANGVPGATTSEGT